MAFQLNFLLVSHKQFIHDIYKIIIIGITNKLQTVQICSVVNAVKELHSVDLFHLM